MTRKTSTKTAAKTGTKTTRRAAPAKAATTAKTTKAASAKSTKSTKSTTPKAKPSLVSTVKPSPMKVVAAATPVVSGPTLRKNDFIDRVVESSGLKRKDVKPIVEATLKALADTLSADEELQAPPLGKLKVHKRKTIGKGEMLMLKLRRGEQMLAADEGLADDSD